jgi:TolA-binding protein
MKRPPTRRGDGVDELLDQLALDDRQGPALPIAERRALALVRLARERCAPEPRGKLLRFPKLPLLGIGVVIATSAAAAALGGFPRLLGLGFGERDSDAKGTDARGSHTAAPIAARDSSAPQAPAAPKQRAPEAPPTPAAVASPAPPQAPPTPAAVASPAPPEAPSLEAREPPALERPVPAPPKPRPTARSASPRATARAQRPSRAAANELELVRVPAPDSAPAADLLGVANRARAERRFSAALDAYRRVIARFPETRQAQIARVSAGDLELERADPRAAEQLFYGAVRDADVGAEALFGLAEAYRAEERSAEERRTLERFVERHPESPLVPAARRRLSELGTAHATP